MDKVATVKSVPGIEFLLICLSCCIKDVAFLILSIISCIANRGGCGIGVNVGSGGRVSILRYCGKNL